MPQHSSCFHNFCKCSAVCLLSLLQLLFQQLLPQKLRMLSSLSFLAFTVHAFITSTAEVANALQFVYHRFFRSFCSASAEEAANVLRYVCYCFCRSSLNNFCCRNYECTSVCLLWLLQQIFVTCEVDNTCQFVYSYFYCSCFCDFCCRFSIEQN